MEQSGEIEISSIEYDLPVEEVVVTELEPGDFLHLKTINGSRYVFQIIMADKNKRYVRCISGNPILVNTSGEIHNDIIKVRYKLVFGKSMSEGVNNTSSLREIIIRKESEPYIAQKEYGISVQELEASSLEVGDFINIKTRNSTYIFKVRGIDKATGQPIVRIVGGNNNFLREKGRILGHVIEVGYPMKTETVTTSPIEEIVVNQNQEYELPEPSNMFGDFEPSIHNIKTSDPDVSKRAASPYYVTEQEVAEALQLEPENLTRATLETAWLFFEDAFKKHLETLGMVERIQEKLRFDRLQIGYESLLSKLPE